MSRRAMSNEDRILEFIAAASVDQLRSLMRDIQLVMKVKFPHLASMSPAEKPARGRPAGSRNKPKANGATVEGQL